METCTRRDATGATASGECGLTGGDIPREMKETYLALLPKEEGKEHILEKLRPICLMQTMMKLITKIWDERIRRAFSAHDVMHPAQEGNRDHQENKWV